MEKLVFCGSAAIKNNSCTNGAVCPSDIDAAGRIRYLIKQNDQAGVVNFLTCLDEVWAYRLLVTTLIDQGKYSQALTNLLRIPDDTPDNIEFKAMCNAIIDNLQAGTNIGGRQSTQVLQQLRTIAQAHQSTQTALAQSTLALLQGDDYVRSSAPIEVEKGESNTLATLEQLTVVPNPAKDAISIYYDGAITLPAILHIYNINGQLIKSVSMPNTNGFNLNIADLKAGLYYCQLQGTSATNKIVVIK